MVKKGFYDLGKCVFLDDNSVKWCEMGKMSGTHSVCGVFR